MSRHGHRPHHPRPARLLASAMFWGLLAAGAFAASITTHDRDTRLFAIVGGILTVLAVMEALSWNRERKAAGSTYTHRTRRQR